MTEVIDRLSSALAGRYRVERELGVGGMATVYLAHDLRHERDVAIKVLHPDLAAALGAERFLAEIKTTAKLQHPHILPLLDSGEAGGLLFYVMPYVAGESLRHRIERETQLPVDEAVRIAREAASALDYAHRQQVVHRDIKPENILLHEGQALVADFGIALAVSAAGGPRMTQTGLSLGTPAYMAPEQAMGERTIDARADIYALGAVLYEMLVGEPPFTGASVQAIIARLMTEEARPIRTQRRSVPAHVEAAVFQALEKLPADRFNTAADFGAALTNRAFVRTTTASRPGVSGTYRREPTLTRRRAAMLAAGGVVAVAAVALGVAAVRERPETESVHLAVDFPPGIDLLASEAAGLSISDDGSTLVFGAIADGERRVFVRRLAFDSARMLPGGRNFRSGPVVSPDGRSVALSVDDSVTVLPVDGGPATPVAPAGWAHVAWAGTTGLVYNRHYDTGLWHVEIGGEARELTKPNRAAGELGHWRPHVLPDNEHVLFTAFRTPADRSTIEVVSLRTGRRKVVQRNAYYARYVDGRLVFVRGATVMVVGFDPKKHVVNGAPRAVITDAAVEPTGAWGAFAVARNGTFTYWRRGTSAVEIVWIDASGREEPAIDSAAAFTDISLSRDGRLLALIMDGDVWVFDRQRGSMTRLTRTPQPEISLRWTPDGTHVLYVRDNPQYDIFKRVADASRAEELVITSPRDKYPNSVSPDGSLLLFSSDVGENRDDLWITSLDPRGRRDPVLIAGGPGAQEQGFFSPNGRWIAYESDESGRDEVYLLPYPAGGGRTRQQVSVNGGSDARWSHDGRTLYYELGTNIVQVSVDPETGSVTAPRPAMRRPTHLVDWVVGPDGRFLVARPPSRAAQSSLRVILNWTQSLRGAAN